MNKYLWKTLSKDSSRGKNIKNTGSGQFLMDILDPPRKKYSSLRLDTNKRPNLTIHGVR